MIPTQDNGQRSPLYIFPRDNPEAPFVPLPTRQIFKKSPLRSQYTPDSDSESSDWYESSSDEDELATESLPTDNSLNHLTGSNSKNCLLTNNQKMVVNSPRSALKTANLASSIDLSFDSSGSESPSIICPKLNSLKVRIVEPHDALEELRIGRDSSLSQMSWLDYNRSSDLGLPSSPKDYSKRLPIPRLLRFPPFTAEYSLAKNLKSSEEKVMLS